MIDRPLSNEHGLWQRQDVEAVKKITFVVLARH